MMEDDEPGLETAGHDTHEDLPHYLGFGFHVQPGVLRSAFVDYTSR